MALSDKEIEEKIEKTVYKLEKFYKAYNFYYKIRLFFRRLRTLVSENLLIFLLIYTSIIVLIMRCIK